MPDLLSTAMIEDLSGKNLLVLWEDYIAVAGTSSRFLLSYPYPLPNSLFGFLSSFLSLFYILFSFPFHSLFSFSFISLFSSYFLFLVLHFSSFIPWLAYYLLSLVFLSHFL